MTTIIKYLVFTTFFSIQISKNVVIEPIKTKQENVYVMPYSLYENYKTALDSLDFEIKELDSDTLLIKFEEL